MSPKKSASFRRQTIRDCRPKKMEMVSFKDIGDVFEDTFGPKWGRRFFIVVLLAVVGALMAELVSLGNSVISSMPPSPSWLLPLQVAQRCVPRDIYEAWQTSPKKDDANGDEYHRVANALKAQLRIGSVTARGHKVIFGNRGEQSSEEEQTELRAGDWQGLSLERRDFSFASCAGSLDRYEGLEMAIVKGCH
jgi:hypothetical protein